MKDQIIGKAQELKGRITGDKAEEMKGKARQQMGDAKAKVRDVQGDLREGWDARHKGDENPPREGEREPGPDQP